MPNQAFYDSIANDIIDKRRKVVGVMDQPPFAYTIGNWALMQPELIILGLHPEEAAPLLNRLSDLQANRRKSFTDGEMVSFTDTIYPFKMVEKGNVAKAEYTTQAGQYWINNDYRLFHAIFCDPNGKYPGDEGCEEAFNVWQTMKNGA